MKVAILFVLLNLYRDYSISAWKLSTNRQVSRTNSPRWFCENVQGETVPDGGESDEITSHEVQRLNKKLETLSTTLSSLKEERKVVDEELLKLDQEYGSEIARIKKEFSRMKERSYEEARDAANKAKIDALKEVLPITDNYFRARQLFQPIQTENEEIIQKTYDEVFASFSKVISDFGVTRVESIGKPFDFNFMEAIMTAPSTEYSPDIVCTEYQVGYKMGDKCIRPAMVVVSTGPGPSK